MACHMLTGGPWPVRACSRSTCPEREPRQAARCTTSGLHCSKVHKKQCTAMVCMSHAMCLCCMAAQLATATPGAWKHAFHWHAVRRIWHCSIATCTLKLAPCCWQGGVWWRARCSPFTILSRLEALLVQCYKLKECVPEELCCIKIQVVDTVNRGCRCCCVHTKFPRALHGACFLPRY